MAGKDQKRTAKLAEIADSNIESEIDLDNQELAELARIKHAMAFIDQIRDGVHPAPNDNLANDTAAIKGEETLQADQELLPPHLSQSVDQSQTAEDHPSSVGRFQIERLLGQGGFAKVFLAKDPKLNRLVALKLLRKSLFFSHDAATRFDREAQAAAILSHPNIVPVFETGELESVRYIASAYCNGITLEQWLKKQTDVVAPELAADIVATLSEAIEHAHQRGIVHRDLKPANILLDRNAGNSSSLSTIEKLNPRSLKIADFGLAKHANTTDIMKTAEGAIVGTPAYMSPEQAHGETSIGHASDIYTLGVILFELLTGQLPIVGKSNIDTLLAIRSSEPKSPRSVNSAIPKDLEAICLKCLNRAPEKRYASAHALAEDLRRWTNGDVVTARRVTSPERAWKWCVRNPVVTTSMVLVTAALVAALLQWRTAVHENQRANRHQEMAQNVIFEMVSKVAKDPELPPSLRKSVAQRAVDLQVQLLAEQPDDPAVAIQTARSYGQLFSLLYDLREFEFALDAVDEMQAVLKRFDHLPETLAIKADSAQKRAGVLRALDKLDEAVAEIEKSELENELPLVQQARNGFQLGMSNLKGNKDLDRAVLEFEKSLAIYSTLENDPMLGVEVARTQMFLGTAEMYRGNLELARESVSAGLAVLSNLVDAMPEKAAIVADYGRGHLQMARTIRSQLEDRLPVEPDHPDLLACREHFEASEAAFRKVFEINPLLPSTHGLIAFGFKFKVQLEIGQQRTDLADEIINDFLKLFKNVPQEKAERQIIGQIISEAQIGLATMLFETGQPELSMQRVNNCLAFLDEFDAEYPGAKLPKQHRQECEELLAKIEAEVD